MSGLTVLRNLLVSALITVLQTEAQVPSIEIDCISYLPSIEMAFVIWKIRSLNQLEPFP